MRTDMHNARPGDFVYTSWGYDQTQVDFYLITALTPSGKSLRVRPAGKRDTGSMGMHAAMVPSGVIAGMPETTVRIINDHVKIDGHYAWLWDGKPQYQTGHGYGH